MKLLLLLLLSCWNMVSAQEPSERDSVSCSKSCRKNSQELHRNTSNTEEIFKFPCSCSKSCALYKDCCYDSEFRNQEWRLSRSSTMCLSLSARGHTRGPAGIRAVSRCPSDWPDSDVFCRESIGFLPPVTSGSTGTTYANIYCAVCNLDIGAITTWNVELRCCAEHDDADDAERRIVYRKGQLWSRIPGLRKCQCSYHVHDNDAAFLDNLELRSCGRHREISHCSSSWEDEETTELCKSFLDPVFVDPKVYRNSHCARCNFERPGNVQCMPDIVARKLALGKDLASILQYCQEHQLQICLYYLDSLTRGRSYDFSDLMNINVDACIPPQGRLCCSGERFDFKAKRCRKIN